MSAARYRLDVRLAGYWHSGTGRGDGMGADAVVARDQHGLPYLPGRHLKGLLRHALRHLEHLELAPVGLCEDLFGRGTDGASDKARSAQTRYGTTQGRLRFGSARLPDAWQAFAAHADPATIDLLFRTLGSTAIDEQGTARARTLRTVELAAPMTLTAYIDTDRPLDPDTLTALRRAAGLVRRVGKHRTRGLGRATLTIEPVAPALEDA